MLKVLSNPHRDGRLTRGITFEGAPGQTYAVDAEELYANPQVLEEVSAGVRLRIRILDVVAYAILILGVLGSFYLAWWLWLPGVALCAAMLHTNKKTAGAAAQAAALKSSQAMLYLHSVGVLWLVVR
ncbi:MAG: hypothetical protein AAFQ67_04280 [Pseudomonadota bacterium]